MSAIALDIVLTLLAAPLLVVGHEASHALVSLLLGARVKKLTIGEGSLLCHRRVFGVRLVLRHNPLMGGRVQGADVNILAFVPIILAGPLFNLAAAYLAYTRGFLGIAFVSALYFCSSFIAYAGDFRVLWRVLMSVRALAASDRKC